MSSIIGYRQMEVPQVKVPNPSAVGIMQMEVPAVGHFKWSLLAENGAIVAAGTIFVFGTGVQVTGWKSAQEYWYVSTLGASVQPHRFAVECMQLVSEVDAPGMLTEHQPQDAFQADMVPSAKSLTAGDPVFSRAVHAVWSSSDLGTKLANDAAVYIELDGQAIKRIDWYWSGSSPLSLFPGGAQVGERIELTRVQPGELGFPKVGWSKCEQPA